MAAIPIQRSNLGASAYAAIKAMIVSGELKPGAKLGIEDLAERLNVSNSPIREALRRLADERWVEHAPYRGAVVSRLDARELAELYEIRTFIELAALSKAIIDPPREQMTAMDRARREIEAALKAGDAMEYLAADARFHQALVGMACNRRLSEMFATLVEQGRCFMLGRTQEAMAQQREQADPHGRILDAIRRKDPAAMRLLAEHLRWTCPELEAAAPGGKGE